MLEEVVNPKLLKDISYDTSRTKEMRSRYTPEGVSTEFSRDVDKLWVKYRSLRLSTKKRLAHSLRFSDSQELDGYINDAFVTLIKEYQPQKGIDLPGYLKSMLYTRARYLYARPIYNRYESENLLDDQGMQITMGEKQMYDSQEDDLTSSFIEYVSEHMVLTLEQAVMVNLILEGREDKEITRRIMTQFDMKRKDVTENVSEVREMLQRMVPGFLN